MGKPESNPSHNTSKHTRRGLHTKHKYLNAFVKRRGAWASLNQPQVIRQATHKRKPKK